VLQLPKRLGLDLADALARHRELLTDLFQRVVLVHADAEAPDTRAREEQADHCTECAMPFGMVPTSSGDISSKRSYVYRGRPSHW